MAMVVALLVYVLIAVAIVSFNAYPVGASRRFGTVASLASAEPIRHRRAVRNMHGVT